MLTHVFSFKYVFGNNCIATSLADLWLIRESLCYEKQDDSRRTELTHHIYNDSLINYFAAFQFILFMFLFIVL